MALDILSINVNQNEVAVLSSRQSSQVLAAEIGKRVRRLRHQQQMSIDQLAKRAHLSVGYLSLLEQGKRAPGALILKKLSVSLAVPVGYLLGEERTQPSDFHPTLDTVAKVLESEQLAEGQRALLDDVVRALAALAESLVRDDNPFADLTSANVHRNLSVSKGGALFKALNSGVTRD